MEGERGKLYIGGLSMEISESALKEYFSKYCEVTDASIIPRKDFGFVKLVDESLIDPILGVEHIILGRKVVVGRARPRNYANIGSNQNADRRIFVGGLPSGVTKDEFKDCFEQFGRVLEVVLIYGKKDRKPRGFGFITFVSDEAIQRVTALRFVPLNKKTVEVKKAKPLMDYKRKTNTFETTNLHLATPSTYNPVYHSNCTPYSSLFYHPFPPCCAFPYLTCPVQYNYYQYVYQFGGSSVTRNGDSSGSPSAVVPSITGPVTAVPSSPTEADYTEQVKFIDFAEESLIVSSTQPNTEQNGDDPAESS